MRAESKTIDRPDGLRPLPLAASAGALFAAALVVLVTLSGCEAPEIREEQAAQKRDVESGTVLTLGDVDPDTPARRTLRLQPLTDYLTERLGHLGIADSRIVIARDMDEMAGLLAEGKVDLYLDSAYPTLIVQERSGARTLLRRWAQGTPEYRTLFVASADSDIESLEQLRGSVLALQEEYSTSGFLLPAGTLVEKGFSLREIGGPDERLTPDAIHYFFTRDEENTIELVSTGRVHAGAISDQEYRQLPVELRDRLRVIAQSLAVPRQLLTVRADLDPELVQGISEVLRELAGEDQPPVVLEDSPQAWTWKFDELSPEGLETIEHLRSFARALGVV